MRVRLSVFYPLSEKVLREAEVHLAKKLPGESIDVVAELRTDRVETKAIVCSFEEHSVAFAGSALLREVLQNRVKTEVSRWAGRQVRVLVSGQRTHPARQKKLAVA